MDGLTGMRCEACQRGAPTVTEEEMKGLLPQVPRWEVAVENEVPRLVRVFEFPDFRAALAFANQVGVIAEGEGHHPALLTEWGKVTVSWWTHKIRGLHKNDFIMAAKTDEVFATPTPGAIR